jgi:hypothetical protein
MSLVCMVQCDSDDSKREGVQYASGSSVHIHSRLLTASRVVMSCARSFSRSAGRHNRVYTLVARRGSRTLEEAEAAMANRAAGNGVKAMPRLAELAAAGPGGDSHRSPACIPEQLRLLSGN